MKFVCTKENLVGALNLVAPLAGKQSNLPILSNVLIDATESRVEFVSTNLEMVVKCSLRAKVEIAGKFTVPAKTLYDFVSLISDEQIEISVEENELVVSCNDSSTKIKGSPSEDYPIIPEAEEGSVYTILVDVFADALTRVGIAAAKNDIRPELSGVYCGFFTDRYEGLVMAATDSYRLAEKKVSVAQGSDVRQCILPIKTVMEVARLLSSVKNSGKETQVRMWVSDNQIGVRYESFEITSRLVSGSYPDYAQIIPTEFKTHAIVSVDAFHKKIKAASLFSSTGINGVNFTLSPSESAVMVASMSSQTGEHSSQVEAQVAGEENAILLNFRYVLDGLANLDSEEMEFLMNSHDAPCMMRGKGKEDYLYLVMPIRQ
ncbi:DNA polymerase III subunit beta [Candidatus Nomurabacteria bacterium]|nr:DNA polymerase III subunit beta [Candidatus Nomurabacteria bacterium]